MNSSTSTVNIATTSASRRVADFCELTKPRIVLMVLITAFVGYYAGSGNVPDYVQLIEMLLGTALAAGGTLTLNQFLERDTDAMMDRTCRRPLPDGRLQPNDALWFGHRAHCFGACLSGSFGQLAERFRRRCYYHELSLGLYADEAV